MTKNLCPCKPEFSDNGYCLACDGTKIKNANREKTLNSNLLRRIPSWEEYLSFDGAHCHQLWAKLDDHWRCPCCERTRYQLLRWTMLYPNKSHRREGWAVGLHTHHDHGTDLYVRKTLLGEPHRITTFAPAIICEQCNSADGAVKRRLGLPPSFTFAPLEIRQFVWPTPHGKHIIHYERAQMIYHHVTTRAPLFFG